MNSNNLIRIEKFLSEQGIASRREAQRLIKAGQIRLNGKPVKETGIKIDPKNDKITLSSSGEMALNQKTTVMIYKPRGVICGADEGKDKTVFDVFPNYRHLNSVGRLDKESEGLLLLSDDGMVTKAITNKTHPSEKEYKVKVREGVLPWMIKKFQAGITIEGGYHTLPAEAEKIGRHEFLITLREGKKHQIRRMANAVGLTIESLKRIRINQLTLGRMRPGQSKLLNKDQIDSLRKRGKKIN